MSSGSAPLPQFNFTFVLRHCFGVSSSPDDSFNNNRYFQLLSHNPRLFFAKMTNVYVVMVLLMVMMWADVSRSKNAAPKVQIYSREPGNYGIPNILICHASGFHPPELSIEMFVDGKEVPKANQTDLAFEENWYYHLTKHMHFSPEKGRQYSCKVTHLGVEKTYHWEPDM